MSDISSTTGSIEEIVEELAEELMQYADEISSSSARQSKRRRRKYVNRDREKAYNQLVMDYFTPQPLWGPKVFRRRFRMRRDLFIRIVNALEHHDEYFQWRADATGRKGFSPLQKCSTAIRQLTYGSPADIWDEYTRVVDSTGIECLKNFCRCVIEVFGNRYLRRPTPGDCERLLQMHEQRHVFPGMLGSLDCMHWEWKNCPVAWKGQFTRGDHGAPIIMLESVASSDLWIWHAFFGVAGSNNDINVLNQSPLFTDALRGNSPEVNFDPNGTHYNKGYYLSDGIYPEWAVFVKSFPCPQDPKRKKFKTFQEAVRKDVERAFGVLQARWVIIRGPTRLWYKEHLKEIIYNCIILHNMIIENEGDDATNWSDEDDTPPEIIQGPIGGFQQYLLRGLELRDRGVHHQLRADLVEHIWANVCSN